MRHGGCSSNRRSPRHLALTSWAMAVVDDGWSSRTAAGCDHATFVAHGGSMNPTAAGHGGLIFLKNFPREKTHLQWHVWCLYNPNKAPYVLITCLSEFRNLITTILINLVVRELAREHRATVVLQQHVVVPRWGWRWRRCRGPIFRRWAILLVTFTSAGRTFAAPVVSCARRWIWRSQCLRQLPLQVVDDDILEVVDVLLIEINSWWIHLL
jgi:hypothetical protein